jgi:hypothetical protein
MSRNSISDMIEDLNNSIDSNLNDIKLFVDNIHNEIYMYGEYLKIEFQEADKKNDEYFKLI